MPVLALSLVLAACGGSAGGESGGGQVSGTINIEGSSTVQPITQAAAELFREENPDARIEVGGAGTSDGFEAFCQGDTQISDASAEDKITKWSQVRSDWPDRPLNLYGPGTESGTYELFNETIVANEEEVSRQSDVEMSEDDNVLVQGVSGDANALGYFGF